jgi:dihydrofolate reductase
VPQIARRMSLTRQSVHASVNRLVRDGFVELGNNADHRRSPLVSLTKRGSTKYEALDAKQAALQLARVAAGDKNVGIWGGANVIRQHMKAGLLDEMQIHLVPILLGGGVRLFEDLDPEGIELRRTGSIETPGATSDSKW